MNEPNILFKLSSGSLMGVPKSAAADFQEMNKGCYRVDVQYAVCNLEKQQIYPFASSKIRAAGLASDCGVQDVKQRLTEHSLIMVEKYLPG